MRHKESVDALRKKIDQADRQIVELLNKRAALAQEIGRVKTLGHEEVYAPNREKAILQKVASLSSGPLTEAAVHNIYREILSASRSVEASIKVAYFGPEATFTHMAARQQFGSSAVLVSVPSIADVFQEVARERAAYGVVPVENSTEGVVTHTLDMLVDSDVKICAEVSLEIHLYLLSVSGRLEDIRCIVSHPQPVAQCRRWMASQLPHVEVTEAASSAQAAQMAAKDPTVAAIASAMAKDLYGLRPIASNIEDHAHNITRFLVIGDQSARPSGDDKSSIVFSVKDEVGILHRMLAPFAKNRINLTKIESRPLKHKPWEYLFFLDFQGHVEEAKVKRAIKDLEKNCLFVKVLGSYPRAV